MDGRWLAGEDEGGIHVLLVELPVEEGGPQPHLHLGVAALEIVQARNEPFERHGDIDLHGDLVVLARGAQLLGLGLDAVEGLAHRREVGLARSGELGAACFAAKQRQAEFFFERADLVADGGTGDAQLVGGAAEAAEPGGGLERGQRAQRWEVAFGQSGSP